MKHKLFIVLAIFSLILALSLNTSSETDISGWRQAKWGMTQSEIARIYDLTDWEEGRARCNLKQKVNIEGHNFSVKFKFDKKTPTGKLRKVTLRSDQKNARNNKIYDSILRFLISKYGEPKPVTDKDFPPDREWLWSKPSGQVELLTTQIMTKDKRLWVFCIITYQSTKSNATNL
jgi:hypothetical protein